MSSPMRGRWSSDVPQETLLGPAQLKTFINDLVRAWVMYLEGCWWYSFTQMGERKAASEDWEEDFAFTFWKLKWQIKFNVSKHEVVHMGKISPSIYMKSWAWVYCCYSGRKSWDDHKRLNAGQSSNLISGVLRKGTVNTQILLYQFMAWWFEFTAWIIHVIIVILC